MTDQPPYRGRVTEVDDGLFTVLTTVDGLVQMRIHRVTPDYIAALQAAGYRPSAEMAVQLRIHGATPDYIRTLGAAGLASAERRVAPTRGLCRAASGSLSPWGNVGPTSSNSGSLAASRETFSDSEEATASGPSPSSRSSSGSASATVASVAIDS